MRILVTGGAGFIGSNFINYIIKNGFNDFILNLDKLTYAGNLNNLKKINKSRNYRFVRGDINNSELISFLIKNYKIDHVVNFAAESHVDNSIKNPNVFVKTNIEGTFNLLMTSLQNNIDKFLQVSTDEVYGSLSLNTNDYFSEKTILNPSSPYSASKASADLLVRSFYKTYRMNVNITRCSNNYGPYQYPEKLIPKLIIDASENKNLPIYGNGKNVRDWIFVIDHVKAIYEVLRSGVPGEIYNIGTHNEHDNNEIAKEILDIVPNTKSKIKYVNDRPGHDERYAIDNSKMIENLDWKPEQKWHDGLRYTVKWYIDHKSWWEPLL